MKLLHIDSSALGAASVSRNLTASIVAAQRVVNPSLDVTYRDLGANPPDHLSEDLVKVVKLGDRANLSDRQAQEVELMDTLVDELLAADTIVIGAPMYNFTIPSQLKAWIDRIAVPGRTFSYGANGPVGLATGKRAIIASTRGGLYAGAAHEVAMDHQEAYLRAFLGFIGITDVTVVRVEGLALGAEAKAKALDTANTQIQGLFLRAAA